VCDPVRVSVAVCPAPRFATLQTPVPALNPPAVALCETSEYPAGTVTRTATPLAASGPVLRSTTGRSNTSPITGCPAGAGSDTSRSISSVTTSSAISAGRNAGFA
jgi:hypothetical protein